MPSIGELPTTTQLVSELGAHTRAPLRHDHRRRGRGIAEQVLELPCLTPAGKYGNTTVINPQERVPNGKITGVGGVDCPLRWGPSRRL